MSSDIPNPLAPVTKARSYLDEMYESHPAVAGGVVALRTAAWDAVGAWEEAHRGVLEWGEK